MMMVMLARMGFFAQYCIVQYVVTVVVVICTCLVLSYSFSVLSLVF